MKLSRWVFFLLSLLLLPISYGVQSKSHDISDLEAMAAIEHLGVIYEQEHGIYSAADISDTALTQWQRIKTDRGKFDLQAGVNWLKVEIENAHEQDKHAYLNIKNHFQMVDVHFYQQVNQLPLKSLPSTLTNANLYYAGVSVKPYEKLTLYIRIDADSKISNRIHLMGEKSFYHFLSEREFEHGAALGGMLFLSLIFWILFFATNDKAVGVLAAYFSIRGLFLSVLLGGNLYYLFDQSTDLRGFELPFLASLSSYFYIWFATLLFKLKASSTRLYKLTTLVRYCVLIYIPIGLMVPVYVNMYMSAALMALVMLYLLAVGLYLTRQKEKFALLFSIVIVLHFVCTFLVTLIGLFSFEMNVTREPIHILSFWLNALLVIILISRLYSEQLKDKHKAQLKALEHAVASQQAQEDLLTLQAENQDELEQRVQERTLELNIALNELEELNRELAEKNTLDELTGLFNRRFYDQKIVAEFRRSKRNLTPLSIVLLDIDHFKQVNDTYGHLAGDKCLSWVGQIIKQNIKRSSDIACRYGGEEFVLILPDTDTQGATALAENIREAILAFDFIVEKNELPLTISSGVSTYIQQDHFTHLDIFAAADKALYQAKQLGRNQTQFLAALKENEH